LKFLAASLVTAALVAPDATAQPRPAPVRMPSAPAMSAARGMFRTPAGFGFGNPMMMMAPYAGGYRMSSYGGMSTMPPYSGGAYPMPDYGFGGPETGYDSSQVSGMAEGAGEARLYSRSLEELGQRKSVSDLLTAAGVPNDQGRLRWPGGLLALPAPEAAELREQIDALLGEKAQHAQAGSGNDRLDLELTRKVDALRKLLSRDKEERFSLPYGSYEQSEQFLAKLKRAESLLRGTAEYPGEQMKKEKK
jgi:hypothetical protein